MPYRIIGISPVPQEYIICEYSVGYVLFYTSKASIDQIFVISLYAGILEYWLMNAIYYKIQNSGCRLTCFCVYSFHQNQLCRKHIFGRCPSYSDYHSRNLTTVSGDVTLKASRLKVSPLRQLLLSGTVAGRATQKRRSARRIFPEYPSDAQIILQKCCGELESLPPSSAG